MVDSNLSVVQEEALHSSRKSILRNYIGTKVSISLVGYGKAGFEIFVITRSKLDTVCSLKFYIEDVQAIYLHFWKVVRVH